MKRIFIWIATILLVVGGFILAFWPVQTWRIYDAGWQPLALTHAESYCAGQVLAENGYTNQANDPRVDECVIESKKNNTTPNIGQAVRWVCDGMRKIDPGFGLMNCMDILNNMNLWFLQHGGYTWSWNDAHPRPIVAYVNVRDAPRGERDDSVRDSGGRFGE